MREASVGAAGGIAGAGKRRLDEENAPMASIIWQPGKFRIMTPQGPAHAEGLVGGPFGLRREARRWRPVWTATARPPLRGRQVAVGRCPLLG